MSPTVRALSADETRALTAARLVAVEAAPYYAHALFAMHAVAAEGLQTFAVDAAWRLYVDPATLTKWGPTLAGGVLVHEVEHLIRDHAGRAQALGENRHHPTWNYATDAAINDGLLDTGVTLPDGVVTPSALGLSPDGLEEAYYAALIAQSPPASDDTEDAGCGSGAGDPAAAWELPSDGTGPLASPVMGDADARITRRMVAEAVRQHTAQHGRGSVPAGITVWAERTLSAPTIPWRRVLGATVRRAVAHAAGAVDYTYSRPGRRRIARVVTPAMRRPLVTVAVVMDTSASMGAQRLGAALNEIRGVIRAAGIGPNGLAVLACDAAVGTTTRVRRVQDVALTGGGGTDMRVGITAAEQLRPRPDVIVVLTDGDTPWPQQPTRSRLVIGLIGAGSRARDNVPRWARTVIIDD